MFDYDTTTNQSMVPDSNQARYAQSKPPQYPLGNITSKNIYLFRGLGDTLADDYDAKNLIGILTGKNIFVFFNKNSIKT